MPGLKLQYFDIRGLAETSRMLLAIAKQEYVDARFDLSFGTPGDFSTIKREAFDTAKAGGELDASLGKLPFLEVDGVKIGQSKAIERYISREFGLMGSTPVEAAQIDAIAECAIDIKQAYQKVRGISDAAEKEVGMTKWFAEDLPGMVVLVEKALGAGPGPFFVGDKISYADVVMYQLLAAPLGFFDNTEGAAAAFAACPKIKAAMEATGANAELQEWIAKRPAGSAPF